MIIMFWGMLKFKIWASAREFQQCGMCDQYRLLSAFAYAQSDKSLCLSLEYSMTVKLLTEHNLGFLRLKGGCTGSSECTHVKCHIVEGHISRLLFVWVLWCQISLVFYLDCQTRFCMDGTTNIRANLDSQKKWKVTSRLWSHTFVKMPSPFCRFK